MFDTLAGLPVHPLFVHAVVVLAPLVALLLVVYALVPRWRQGLRWPLTLMALASAGAAWVAVEAGEAFAERRGAPGFDHEEKGELAAISVYVLAGVCLLVVFLLARVVTAKVSAVGAVLALAAAGFVGYAVFMAGHSGSESVWSGVVSQTTDG